MEFDYEKYEQECDKIRTINDNLLAIFEQDLLSSGLSKKTVNRHLSNIDFYINVFLLREEPLTMEQGIYKLDMFLGYFFIRKCAWSTPSSIRSTATSIKKFYKCMAENGKINADDYDYLCIEIKDNIKDWQFDCEMFNDPYAPNPFALF